MSTVRLDIDDAVDVASVLAFLVDWLDVLAGHELRWLPLADSAHRIADLRATLTRAREQLVRAEILP